MHTNNYGDKKNKYISVNESRVHFSIDSLVNKTNIRMDLSLIYILWLIYS